MVTLVVIVALTVVALALAPVVVGLCWVFSDADDRAAQVFGAGDAEGTESELHELEDAL